MAPLVASQSLPRPNPPPTSLVRSTQSQGPGISPSTRPRQQINGPGPVLIGPLGLQKCLLIHAVYQPHWLPRSVVCYSPLLSTQTYVDAHSQSLSHTHSLPCIHTSSTSVMHLCPCIIIAPFPFEHGVNSFTSGVRSTAIGLPCLS